MTPFWNWRIVHVLNHNRTELLWRKLQSQSKIHFLKSIFKEHLNQIRYVFKTYLYYHDDWSPLKQICEFIITIYYIFKAYY